MIVDDCPSKQDLESFTNALLSEETSHSIELHLSRCVICREQVESNERQSDHLDQLLRRAATQSVSRVLKEPEFETAVKSICDRQFSGEFSVFSPTSDDPDDGPNAVETIADESTIDEGISSTSKAPPSTIRTLGQYDLIEEIGRGGMGVVYRALHRKLDRQVAVKVLPETLVRDSKTILRFENEMKAIGRLDHPNVVRAIDANEVDGLHLLVMELVDGENLATYTQNNAPLSIDEASNFIRQTALGLQHIYESGMVHRDLKPSNLILTVDGAVQILDLGLASLGHASQTSPSGSLTLTGKVVGTVDFMAPEQAEDSRSVDVRADIYSLGATFYYLLTGHSPLSSRGPGSVTSKLNRLATDSPRPVNELRQEVSKDLARIISRMMAKDPSMRFSTPSELIHSLDRLQLAQSLMPSRRPAVPKLFSGRKPVVVALVFCILVASIIWPTIRQREKLPAEKRDASLPIKAAAQPSSAHEASKTDPSPTFRSQIEIAEFLIRNGAKIGGSFDGKWINAVTNLSFYKGNHLDIGHVQFSNGASVSPATLSRVLSQLPRVTVFTMCEPPQLLPGHLQALERCNELEVLCVGSPTRASSVNDDNIADTLAGMPKLRALSLFSIRLNGSFLEAIPNPDSLQELSIGSPNPAILPSQLADVSPSWMKLLDRFGSLRSLKMPRIRLSREHLLALSTHPMLHEFHCYGSPGLVKHLDAFGKFRDLRHLNIATDEIRDEDLVNLRDCKDLQTLNLGDAKVSDLAIRKLQQHLTKCRIKTNSQIFEPLESIEKTTN